MSIAVLVLTDGRDELLERTLASAGENLRGDIIRWIIHTDAGMTHKIHLVGRYPDCRIIGGERQGFGGAIDRAWQFVGEGPERFVFHLEDDFTFNRPVDLDVMAEVLDTHPHLAQMALRRQPWNDAERQAGGIVEQWPDAYEEKTWDGHRWLEHRLFFTTNPSLIPMKRIRRGWPTVPRSEGVYSAQVFGDPEVRSAFWGARNSGEWCFHIGNERAGTGY